MLFAVCYTQDTHRDSNAGPLRETNCAVLSTIERSSGGGTTTPTANVCVETRLLAPAGSELPVPTDTTLLGCAASAKSIPMPTHRVRCT